LVPLVVWCSGFFAYTISGSSQISRRTRKRQNREALKAHVSKRIARRQAYYAPFVSARIPAQSCNFTIQDDPDRDLQTYDPGVYANPYDFDLDRIEKWRVPAETKNAFVPRTGTVRHQRTQRVL
jgi:hypothetical protein